MCEKVIVTGGSGFIGTNMISYLLSKNMQVINIDTSKPRNKEQNKYWKKVDITNYNNLKEAILGFNPDYIIHLAARTDLNGESLDDYRANTIGTENLLNIVKMCKDLKKVILASSMLVCKLGYIPHNEIDFCPNSNYGESKSIMEKIIHQENISCAWNIIRPTSIWGPWFGEPYRDFFDIILKKRYVHIGNKSATCTYGYVGNAVYQIFELMKSDICGGVFYIGDYEPNNLEDWANEIASEKNIHIMKIPFIIIKLGAIVGDILKKFKITFPLTTFRLNNMTQNNIIELDNLKKIAPILPYTRKEGTRLTLEWIREKG